MIAYLRIFALVSLSLLSVPLIAADSQQACSDLVGKYKLVKQLDRDECPSQLVVDQVGGTIEAGNGDYILAEFNLGDNQNYSHHDDAETYTDHTHVKFYDCGAKFSNWRAEIAVIIPVFQSASASINLDSARGLLTFKVRGVLPISTEKRRLDCVYRK